MSDGSGANSATAPIGVVVVNYHGDDRTLTLLDVLNRQRAAGPAIDIVVVNNGSAIDFAEVVRQRHPSVSVLASATNVGYGGGVNLGFAALRDHRYVAVLNNDALPEPGWLEHLVDGFITDRIGATTPKVLLAGEFDVVDIQLRSATRRAGGGDSRELGLQFCGARVGARDASEGVHLASGMWGWEHDATGTAGRFSWSGGTGSVCVPLGAWSPGDHLQIRVGCVLGPTVASVRRGGGVVDIDIDREPAWVDLGPVAPVRLINNAGIVSLPDGSAADRGFLEPDRGQFDVGEEVFACSGAAVMFRREFLDDVGDFDEKLFLYYEDVDLCWRGRRRGWFYQYVPEATVVHEHSATVGSGSPLATHLSARNRLVVLTKNASARVAARAWWIAIAHLVRSLVQDSLRPLLRGRTPVSIHVVAQARVVGAAIAMTPRAVGLRLSARLR